MSSSATVPRSSSTTAEAAANEDLVYRKVTWRLLPFLMACYVVAYLDRVNVGFAKLQMLSDLGFSETVYGLGAGIFFIGYFFFEVPSNVILHKVGARMWIARIMITWGIISASFMFVKTVPMFYFLRFLLGVAEAGFYPGIILYLTYWYPSERRARVTALFMIAIPISGIIGGPLSGWIMSEFHDNAGWRGWQWMFLLEAIPSVIMGIVTIFYLDSSVRSAKWLTDAEKRVVETAVARDGQTKHEHGSVLGVFKDGRVWLLSAIYFCIVMGNYGLTLWLPTLIQATGVVGVLNIGLLTAIPYSGAVTAMVLFSRSADRRRERRFHVIVLMLIGALGLVMTALTPHSPTLAIIGLTIAAGGAIGAAPLFWSLPTAFLGGVSAAAGIATINSIGNLAGFVSPYMVGWLRDAMNNRTDVAMYVLAVFMIIGAAAILRIPARLVNR
jgi:D-galactonate transporter